MTPTPSSGLTERFKQTMMHHPKAWATGLAISCLLLGFAAGSSIKKAPLGEPVHPHRHERGSRPSRFPSQGETPPQAPSDQNERPTQDGSSNDRSQTPASSSQGSSQ